MILHAVKLIAAPVRSDADIERAISSLGDKPTTGLLVAGELFLNVRLDLITSLTTRYRLVTICPFRFFLPSGVV